MAEKKKRRERERERDKLFCIHSTHNLLLLLLFYLPPLGRCTKRAYYYYNILSISAHLLFVLECMHGWCFPFFQAAWTLLHLSVCVCVVYLRIVYIHTYITPRKEGKKERN